MSANAIHALWRRPLGGRAYIWLAVAALIVSAVTMLWPSTPSYDPWTWLIWGREIVHGSLVLKGLTSWKPLPVIFTTVFAPFGHLQPDLWMFVERAAMVLSLLMISRLAFRLTWDLQRPVAAEQGTTSSGAGRPRIDRSGRWVGPLISAVLALVALALTGVYLSNSAIGYSESLAVAAILIGFERGYDGHHLQAYALGLTAALDRPETLLFLLPYGLWMLWRLPQARPWVIALGVVTLALWFVPQELATGSFTGSVKAAKFVNPGSAGRFPCPFCHEMHYEAYPMAPVQLQIASGLAGVAALLLLGRSLLAGAGRRAARLAAVTLTQRQRAQLLLCLTAAAGILWELLIAVDVSNGFAGNERYMVVGSSLVILSGSIAFGWAALELSALGGAHGLTRGRQMVFAALVCVSVLLFVPKWIGHRMINIGQTRQELRYQVQLRSDVAALVDRIGGSRSALACGTVEAEHFQIPMVAWYLGVPPDTIQDTPGEWKEWGSERPRLPLGYPNLIFQTSASLNWVTELEGHPVKPHWQLTPASPDMGDIGRWEHAGAHYSVLRDDRVTLYKDCKPIKAGA